jgi:broad specificity phosphatase PhoE
MRTTLYLIRHGETEYNRRQILQGRRIDCGLNETGRRQAEALARRLAAVPFDAAYASTLLRAVETAEILLAGRDLPVERLADLDEMSWGIYEGQPYSDALGQKLAEMYGRWDRGEFDYRVEQGESIHDVEARARRAVAHIVARHPGRTVLVVTHGRLLRVLLASVLDGYGLARMNDIQHSNTAVNRIVYAGGRYEADLLNCTVHLDAVALDVIE